ncbi:hypothetical protein HK096_004352 [Nowakowskiella sp. JEL0078]|nr:hypothetical protein HK096_004352 [Nowakowskiella sp. JEL0078]
MQPDPTIDPITGKKCRVCTSFKNWSKNEGERQDGFAENTTSELNRKKSNVTNSDPYFDCPPDSIALGRSTWNFLHTMAAYYPSSPSQTQQTQMQQFLSTFSQFYPCGYCASHLQNEMEKNKPRVENNKNLSLWMCEVHNEVNEKLGKPKFDCSKVFERWKDGFGDGRCD